MVPRRPSSRKNTQRVPFPTRRINMSHYCDGSLGTGHVPIHVQDKGNRCAVSWDSLTDGVFVDSAARQMLERILREARPPSPSSKALRGWTLEANQHGRSPIHARRTYARPQSSPRERDRWWNGHQCNRFQRGQSAHTDPLAFELSGTFGADFGSDDGWGRRWEQYTYHASTFELNMCVHKPITPSALLSRNFS
jgi:hypothetical protein